MTISEQVTGPLVLATILIMEVVVLVLVILYRDQLFLMSMGYIFDYQQRQSSGFVIFFYNAFSVICSTFAIVGLITFLHVVLKRKLVTLMLVFYIACNAYVMAIQKQCYQDTRPFLRDLRIRLEDWLCEASYGFPSGHSWVSFLVFGLIIDDLIGTAGKKKLLFVWLLLVGTLNPVSRMYLGSHSADHILYATFNSVAMLVLYHFFLQKKIYQLFQAALKGHHFTSILVVNTIILLLALSVPITLFEVNIRYRDYPQIYLDRLNSICNDNLTYFESQRNQGVSVTIITLASGIVYGLLVSSKMRRLFEVRHEDGRLKQNKLVDFMVGKWNYKNLKNFTLHVLTYGVFFIVFLFIFVFVLQRVTDNFYGMFFLSVFGYLCLGISLGSFIPLLLMKFNAIQFEEQRIEVQAEAQVEMAAPGTQQRMIVTQ